MAIADENVRIQITIPRDLREELRIKAGSENRSISNYVHTLIKNDLEGHGDDKT